MESKDYAIYVVAWQKRLASEEQERKKLREEAYQVARHGARLLKDKFGVKKVYLFGSLLSDDFFWELSDIDLLIEGLSSRKYFQAVSKLQDLSSFKIDLIMKEDCPKDWLKNMGALEELDG
ncbi:MAG TPA: DNA polymerase subunit beta [Syntrophaceae bacterium]|nr:DNA polymerase subunit beta [Syntrophaceae bacterium]